MKVGNAANESVRQKWTQRVCHLLGIEVKAVSFLAVVEEIRNKDRQLPLNSQRTWLY
jgi:hypothetical protein